MLARLLRTTNQCAAGSAPGTYPFGINIDATSGVILPRPDRVAPIHMVKKQAQWFSTDSFTQAVGHFGNSGNGVLLGPGLELWDLSAIKNNKITERLSFQFRAEFFNAFNHTNFSTINTISERASTAKSPPPMIPARFSSEASCTSS